MKDTPSAKPRVLIVDDDAALRRALKRLLVDTYRVECIPSGTEALARLRTGEPFDVLITDLVMADLTGMQLYDTVAQERPEDTQRFIFLTGSAEAPSPADRGPVTVLFKPIDSAQLHAAIDAKVQESPGAPADDGPDRGKENSH